MVVDGHLHDPLRPFDSVWISAFSRKVKRPEARDIIVFDHLAFWVFAFDRAECCRRCEKAAHVMVLDNAPEGARIRCADWLPFEHNRGVAVDQRPVANVRVPNDPTHVRCSPEHISRIDVVDVFHRPVQCNKVPCCWSHHALGRAGRAGCV